MRTFGLHLNDTNVVNSFQKKGNNVFFKDIPFLQVVSLLNRKFKKF